MGGSADHPPGSLGELLAARRREQFVGRAGELELFGSALAADDRRKVLLIDTFEQ